MERNCLEKGIVKVIQNQCQPSNQLLGEGQTLQSQGAICNHRQSPYCRRQRCAAGILNIEANIKSPNLSSFVPREREEGKYAPHRRSIPRKFRDDVRYANHSLRKQILERDLWACRYCHRNLQFEDTQVDHVIPWSRGGKTVTSNLVASCRDCNLGRNNRMDKKPKKLKNHIKKVRARREQEQGEEATAYRIHDELNSEIKAIVGE